MIVDIKTYICRPTNISNNLDDIEIAIVIVIVNLVIIYSISYLRGLTLITKAIAIMTT